MPAWHYRAVPCYYNEIDPKAAAWLRELIHANLIAPGDVDERSIVDITPADLAGYDQCHFFAGIGGWSYALRLAGWPDDRPVWTGSCPCQPFSAAGRQAGFADERHLWPSWLWLIQQRRPTAIFGEQVASAMQWIDLVQGDLEAEGYTIGYAVLGAHSVGAPHIRQRLYFVAECGGKRWQRGPRAERPIAQDAGERGEGVRDVESCSVNGDVADHHRLGRQEQRSGRILDGERAAFGNDADGRGAHGDLEHASSDRRQQRGSESGKRGIVGGRGTGDAPRFEPTGLRDAGILGDDDDDARFEGRSERRDGAGKLFAWEASLVECRDGKRRPTQPGIFPLAHGVPGRVGLLRGYGNAIVPQVAAAFIQAYLECRT